MSETQAEYCGGSSIFVGLGGPQHYPIGGYKITEAGEKLLRSDDRLRQIESTLEWLTVAVNRDGGRLNKLENSQTAVDGNSREYYEQKIEEISGKWQAAEENYQRMKANEAERKLRQAYESIEKYKQNRDTAAETISELREKLDVSEGMRRDAAELYVSDNDQLKAISAKKDRELEQARSGLNWSRFDEIETDAKLGALVRQMPDKACFRKDGRFVLTSCVDNSSEYNEWASEVLTFFPYEGK